LKYENAAFRRRVFVYWCFIMHEREVQGAGVRIAAPLVAARWTLAAATIICFVFAVMPGRLDPVHIWDKAKHFMAFSTLMVLAVMAYPYRRLLVLGAALSGFGAFIEVVQGLPIVHRDSSFEDWVADTCAVLLIVLLIATTRLRVA
jgi:VanZ family protein